MTGPADATETPDIDVDGFRPVDAADLVATDRAS